MKKLLAIIIGLLAAILIINTANAVSKPKVTDHEKINVYIFRGSGCSHCYEALTYFYGLNGEYDDYFNVIAYEVWYDKANAALAKAVAGQLGDDFSGVPYIVVGEKSFVGFGEGYGEAIVETALDYYKSSKYKDVVASVAKSKSYNESSETLNEAAFSEGITNTYSKPESADEKKNDTWVIIAVFAVIIGGFGALVYSARK